MKNKHPHAAVVLVLGLAMAGLHLADLLLWSEADTGFAAAGSVWLRYIPWLAAFALPYLPARRAAAQPAGLQDTNKPLGVCMALAGAALLASGVAAGNAARYAILYPEVLSGSCPVWAAWADLLLPIFAGAWLLNYAVRAFSGFGLQRQRLGSSLLAGAVPLVFLWRLIWRFQFAPASLCRMPCTLRVLSAAAALLLAVVLIKIFLVPGLPCGHTLYAAGTGAFLLCTGLELPQTLFEAARGMLTLPDLLTGIGIGLFGLCGLVCAWEACGKETELSTPASGKKLFLFIILHAKPVQIYLCRAVAVQHEICRGGRLAQGQGGGERQPHRGGPGTAAGGCDIRPAAVQQRGQVAGHPRRIAALQGQHRSTLLRRQPHGGAALTAQNSAQERQYGALQKRPGHGSGQRGVCRAEVQPPRTAVRQLPHSGAERVQLGVQLQCAGRRGRGQGLRRQHQPQRRQNVRPAGRRSRQRRACRAENRHEHSLTFCANSGVSLPRRKRFCAGNGWDFKISVDFLKNCVKRITDPLAEL